MSKIPSKRTVISPSKVVFRPRRVTATTQPVNYNARKSLNNPSLKIGDRVITNDKSGTIAFIGLTKFADGEWIGINLDEPVGKNDGSYNGIRYFETDANHGLFCRPDVVKHLSINTIPQRHSMHNPSRLTITEPVSNNILGITTIDKQDLASTKNLQLGDRVIIRGEKYGILKYIGKIDINEGIWCGIKLDGPFGRHDGKIQGKRYFQCSHRHGVFAPLRHVEKIVIDINNPQTYPRESFISEDSNNQHHNSDSPYSHLSEFSTSSNEANHHFPARSPIKIKQPILTNDVTSSSEIANLLETIKEKDLLIGNLQGQHEKNRLDLQRQYELKENENKNLLRQQIELTQRLEDLQFQFESNQTEINIPDDHLLLTPNEIQTYEQIKENIHQLETINKQLREEKQIYQEELKRYDQSNKFIDQLKEQNELLKSQVMELQHKEQIQTTQLVEKETSYQQHINDYQSKIEQILEEEQKVELQLTTLEEDKNTNEQRMNELLDELNQYKENIVPELESQCDTLKLELQNRDKNVNITSNERETHYEQQIKEYQNNINQATRETEKIRAELQQILEENDLKEKQTNALINELKQNYEQLQLEINDQEHQLDKTIDQREVEYENNLNQATRETENIQAQLTKLKEEYEALKNQDSTQNVVLNENEINEYRTKIDQEVQSLRDELKSLQEEKLAHEEQLNKTIETLKAGQQELQNEVDELNEREHKAHKALHQHESQFDQQIREYQDKLDQADLEIQQLQSELTNLQEEKTNFNDRINSLAQDLEVLQNELQDRDQMQNTTFSEHEAHYKSQINEHQARTAQALLEIQDLKLKLTNLQQEKTTMENKFKQDYEKLQNEGELQVVKDLHERDLQITEYQEKLEQADLEIQRLHSEVEKIQIEKNESNDTIHSLSQNIEALKTELQDQDRTYHEHEDQYKFTINEQKATTDQALLEIQHLHSKLTSLQEEKTTIEDKLNKTIDTLKHENEGVNNTHEQLQQRDLQINEYQEKLEQTNLEIQHLQSELGKLQTESNDTIISLSQDLETLKNELQSQDRTYHEHEEQYKSEINEQKVTIDQALLEIQHLQSKLTNLQQETTTNVDELNEIIDILKQENEKLRNEQEQKEDSIAKKYRSKFEQEIDEYQRNLELSIDKVESIQSELVNLQEEKESNEKILHDEINSLKLEYDHQIQTLKTQINDLEKQDETKEKQLKHYRLEYDETNELIQRINNLTSLNETLKAELDDTKNQHNSTEDDQLIEKVNELQQLYTNLLEKHANKEQEYVEEKQTQEKIIKEKIDDYEMKMRLLKNEFMVEMENNKLDHEQEVLRLKALIPKVPPPKGKK